MSLMHFEPAVGTSRQSPSPSSRSSRRRHRRPPPQPEPAPSWPGGDHWAWSDLRDYVVSQIETRFGAFPRDAKKEAGIFKSFLARHGDDAVAIARFAFEVEDGYWAGAPISVNRFCKASDPYFAEKIKPRMVAQPVTGW